MIVLSVRQAVELDLDGRSGWLVEAALALAGEVDENGSASAARELRVVMGLLAESAPVAQVDPVDRVAEKRAERRRKAAG